MVRRVDLEALSELVQAGEVRPLIDRAFPLAQTADAVRYLAGGHARGKIAIAVSSSEDAPRDASAAADESAPSVK